MMFDNYGLSELPLENNDYGANEKMTNEIFYTLKANATNLAKRVEQRWTFVKTKYSIK